MLREITKDVGRYREGETHDYPRGVWGDIATAAKQPLDSFSRAIEGNPTHQARTRGEQKIRPRLGSTGRTA
jgi:hypothetical protein